MSWAVQGIESVYKLYTRAVFKADIRRIRPLQDGNSEHFLSGAGCGGLVHAP